MHHNPLQEKWNLAKYPEDYKWSSAILQYWHRQFRVSYTLYGTFWIVPVSVPQTGEQEKWLFNDKNKKP